MTKDEMKKYCVEKLQKCACWSEDAFEVAFRAGFKCEYCCRNFLKNYDDYDAFTIDHIVPKTKGGPDGIDNLAASCRTCNRLKKAWPPEGNCRDERVKAAKAWILNKRLERDKEFATIKKMFEEISGIFEKTIGK